MVNQEQWRQYIIRPVLNGICSYSANAEELLVFTFAAESNGGTYIRQYPTGPALGPYQMEAPTHDDIWRNYLVYITKLVHDLMTTCKRSIQPTAEMMVWDMYYATAMARIHYLRNKDPIPDKSDLNGIAAYYKKYWNTSLGKADPNEAIEKYLMFTGESKHESKPRPERNTQTQRQRN